jgi:hypothetical protein
MNAAEIIFESTLSCPLRGHVKTETMPLKPAGILQAP